jgi:hypothetical protein
MQFMDFTLRVTEGCDAAPPTRQLVPPYPGFYFDDPESPKMLVFCNKAG